MGQRGKQPCDISKSYLGNSLEKLNKNKEMLKITISHDGIETGRFLTNLQPEC
jgi:hypothetical protein